VGPNRVDERGVPLGVPDQWESLAGDFQKNKPLVAGGGEKIPQTSRQNRGSGGDGRRKSPGGNPNGGGYWGGEKTYPLKIPREKSAAIPGFRDCGEKTCEALRSNPEKELDAHGGRPRRGCVIRHRGKGKNFLGGRRQKNSLLAVLRSRRGPSSLRMF